MTTLNGIPYLQDYDPDIPLDDQLQNWQQQFGNNQMPPTPPIPSFDSKLKGINKNVADNSPFGKNSIFYEPEPLNEDDFKNITFKSIDNDWELLLESIFRNGVGHDFLLKYTDYDTSNSIRNHSEPNIYSVQPEFSEKHKKYISNSEFFINKYSSFSCKVNTLINFIDTYNCGFGLSFYNNFLTYYLKFYYQYDKIEDVRKPDTSTEYEDDYITEDKYAGIIFRSNNINDIYAIVNFLKGKGHAEKTYDAYVTSTIFQILKTKRSNITNLKILYEQIPLFVLQKMTNKDLWDDLLSLIKYDDAYITKDSSCAVIKCICSFKDIKYIFDNFIKDPQLIIHIYHNLDGTNTASNKEQVQTYQSAKMSFVSILNILCWENRDSTVNKNVTFKIGEDAEGNKYNPSVNLTEGGEDKGGQIYLNQQNELNTTNDIENHFHPLDMIDLILFDKDHNPMVPKKVPAIYVKAMARDVRVEEITFALKLVGDIIMLMLSVITVWGSSAAPAIYLRILSYADMFLAGTDVGVQASRKYLEQSELGRQFYKLWDEIYNYGGFATAAPLLVHSFYKLGLASIKALPINSLERLAIIDEMIRATTERNTFLSKFTLEIIVDADQAAIITGNRFNIGPVRRLMEADVLFIRGTHLETVAEEFFAIYKGEIIAQGTAKEIRETLKEAMNAVGKARIIAELNKLFDTVYIGDDVLLHSNIVDFAGINNPKKSLEPGKMLGGGHGEANIVKLNQLKRSYKIEYVYENGVRIGSISQIADKFKKTTSNKIITGQSWFPVNWDTRKIYQAGKFVINNKFKEFIEIKDGLPVFDTFEGVRVGVMKTDGKPATIFPDNAMQPKLNSTNFEYNPFKK